MREDQLSKPTVGLSGKSRNDFVQAALLALVSFGAGIFSVIAYAPQASFVALGEFSSLAPYLLLATILTMLIVASSYQQIAKLFPSGGGGYRVVSKIGGPYCGLVTGAALWFNYVLIIAISVASAVDVLASLLPVAVQAYKPGLAVFLAGLMLVMGLRLRKPSVHFLRMVLAVFLLTHIAVIAYGLLAHATALPLIFVAAGEPLAHAAPPIDWHLAAGVLLLACAQAGAVYARIETIFNNVNLLPKPHAGIARVTLLVASMVLVIIVGGLFFLYLLWPVTPVEGETLNATTFRLILSSLFQSKAWLGDGLLAILLLCEAGVLMVAAHIGFLGGPAILSNMAVDSWVPHQFRYLSMQLVRQNGILVMAMAALAILFWTQANVALLLVMYAIAVFLSMTISLAALARYWWRYHPQLAYGKVRFVLAALGALLCALTFVTLLFNKFAEGGWLTLVVIAAIAALCLVIRAHYRVTKTAIRAVDQVFASQAFGSNVEAILPDPLAQTAVFVVGTSRGSGLHSLLWVQRMFPGHFKNFIFVNARTVDVQAHGGEGAVEQLRAEANATLQFFVDFCRSHGIASTAYLGFGTDAVQEVARLCREVREQYPQTIFFASKLVFEQDNWLMRLLHNQAALAIQRRLHFDGLQMMILPIKV